MSVIDWLNAPKRDETRNHMTSDDIPALAAQHNDDAALLAEMIIRALQEERFELAKALAGMAAIAARARTAAQPRLVPYIGPTRDETPIRRPREGTDKKALVSSVLYALLVNLDGWIQGARENHDALGHRGESVGGECWTQFHPADIRSMINDVAREFAVGEFPRPDCEATAEPATERIDVPESARCAAEVIRDGVRDFCRAVIVVAGPGEHGGHQWAHLDSSLDADHEPTLSTPTMY